MKKKNILIVVILTIIILELILIKPISYSYYNFNIWGKTIYLIGVYGFPIYLLIPIFLISAFLLVFSIKKKNYRTQLIKLSGNLYLGLSFLIVFITSSLVVNKFVFNKELFPLIEYSSIKGTDADLSDIREGTFMMDNYIVTRDNMTETTIIKSTNDTITSDLKWISNNEYEVTSRTKNNWLIENKTRVKITNNTPDFYECYYKYGHYGVLVTINK
ncbi:hypothetical protein [Carboxylicivirga sp. RSCT41]|uniref:hypothetical protein n=1 Tax=Carboxylicivirga agarovorans TaxID=3417570 RepID=UPI003D34BC42